MAQTENDSARDGIDARLVLGFSAAVGPGRTIAVDAVLPNSPAEAAGLEHGAVINALNGESVADFEALVACMKGASLDKALALSTQADGKESIVEIVPTLVIFPYHAFAAGLEINKFCDSNCDCTLDQPGWFCKTIYRHLGDGPHGGVLLQKICVSIDPSPALHVELPTVCWTGEFV